MTMPKVLESLRLQKQFHTKQIDMIIIRREQHEKCLAAQQILEQGNVFRNNLDDSRQVQMELFKSLDNAEKVVEVLEQKTLSTANREASEFLSKLFDDLKLLNQQSMVLVNRLVTQLDSRINENEDLRDALQENNVKSDETIRGRAEKKLSKEDSDPELHKLEELAPLELPSFDFNTFTAAPMDSKAVTGEDGDNLRRIGFSSLEEGEEAEERE